MTTKRTGRPAKNGPTRLRAIRIPVSIDNQIIEQAENQDPPVSWSEFVITFLKTKLK